jgi:hypothetical protein
MAVKPLPPAILAMLASRRHRLRHFLWHAVRSAWNSPALTADVRQLIRDKGWAPPNDRVPFDAKNKLQLDNFSGEDFLYMHRQMILEVNDMLTQLGEPKLVAWDRVPGPGEKPEFGVPPAWVYADPQGSAEDNQRMTTRLKLVKSDEYFQQVMGVWQAFYTAPTNLARLSLGALGNLVEMTIHNNMHMRWAAEPTGYMPSPNFENTTDIDPKWDEAVNDYLGDTYSSHVNTTFWYLHGWVDGCIDRWAQVNGVESIEWTGTWTGKLEGGWTHGQPQVLTKAIRMEAFGTHMAGSKGRAVEHGGHDDGGHGGHGGHGGQDNQDLRDMEEIVRRLGSCKVLRNFYDVLREPF